MAVIDMVCRNCGAKTRVVTGRALRREQKVCGSCGSAHVRQTLMSYLGNGALSDPRCGEGRVSRGYG
jgi:transposase-like protein